MSKIPYAVELNDHCLLKVSGKDAASFLQGQLSCDIHTVTLQHSSLGCCCDRKGRVLFSFRIFLKDDNYYLYLPKSIAESALQHLQKYVIIAKVNLQIEACVSLGLGGDEIKLWLGKHIDHMPEKFNEAQLRRNEILICIDDKNPRYLVINASAEIYAELNKASLNNWRYAEIEQGLVTIYPETQGLFIPQMLDYEKWGAISFTKGCYVGQEIIARTQHLGKLKRHLHHLNFSQAVQLGEEITHADKKGIAAAVCLNSENQYAVLAVMQD